MVKYRTGEVKEFVGVFFERSVQRPFPRIYNIICYDTLVLLAAEVLTSAWH